jgi:hypothetical protein
LRHGAGAKRRQCDPQYRPPRDESKELKEYNKTFKKR